jgi:hypothetical protein
MRVITASYLLLIALLPAYALAATSYCKGNFAVDNNNCAKFQFDKLKKNGQCTDSKKKTSGQFTGMKLSNCTT